MAKVQVISTLVNEEGKRQVNTYLGIQKEGVLLYQDSLEKFEWRQTGDTLIFTKEKKNESKMIFPFQLQKETSLTVHTKEGTLEIPLDTKKMQIEKHQICMEYVINKTETFRLTIECR